MYIWKQIDYMKVIELRNLIRTAGKRGAVSYREKEKRKKFDESVSLKKVNLISNFLGNKAEEVAKILES